MKPEDVTPEEVVAECTRCHVLLRATQYRKWPPTVRWEWEVYGICPLCSLVDGGEDMGLYDEERDCG